MDIVVIQNDGSVAWVSLQKLYQPPDAEFTNKSDTNQDWLWGSRCTRRALDVKEGFHQHFFIYHRKQW